MHPHLKLQLGYKLIVDGIELMKIPPSGGIDLDQAKNWLTTMNDLAMKMKGLMESPDLEVFTSLTPVRIEYEKAVRALAHNTGKLEMDIDIAVYVMPWILKDIGFQVK